MRGLQQRCLTPLVRHAAQLIAVAEFEASRFSQSMAIARERFSVVPNGAQLFAAPVTAVAGKRDPLDSVAALDSAKNEDAGTRNQQCGSTRYYDVSVVFAIARGFFV